MYVVKDSLGHSLKVFNTYEQAMTYKISRNRLDWRIYKIEKTMKKILLTAIMLMCLMNNSIQAQEIKRNGNTFSAVKNSSRGKAKADTLVTTFTWEDSKGNKYPIIVNKKSGRCYVWKTSSKTGNKYKYYLPESVCKQVCKFADIKYVEKTSK